MSAASNGDTPNGGQASPGEGQVGADGFTALEEEVITGDINDVGGNSDDDDALRIDDALDDDDDDDDALDDGEEEEEEENNSDADDQQEESEPEQPQKRVQTPEENAFYAEIRRRQEALQQQQQMLQQFEAMRRSQPDYQLAQALSQQYGMTPAQLLQIVQQHQIQQEAQMRGVTPDAIIRERELAQREKQLAQQQQMIQFQAFQARMEQEGASLKQQYPSLTSEEFTNAVAWMVRNNAWHMRLSEAVRALYADKLYQDERKALKQDVLAEMSGRKKGIVPPQGGKAQKPTTGLSPLERHFAKQMGISEKDWAKYKTK